MSRPSSPGGEEVPSAPLLNAPEIPEIPAQFSLDELLQAVRGVVKSELTTEIAALEARLKPEGSPRGDEQSEEMHSIPDGGRNEEASPRVAADNRQVTVRPKVPEVFDGEQGGDEVEDWYFGVVTYCNIMGEKSDAARVEFMGSLFRGFARGWFRAITERCRRHQKPVPTMSEWLEMLRAQFVRKNEKFHVRREIRKLTQGVTDCWRAGESAFSQRH